MKYRQLSGFTYLGLLFILVLMGITLALAGTLWSFTLQREKERELLFIGNQFRQAIGMFYEKTPGVIKRYPQTLGQLLEDDRYISTQRYLRRIYLDPMTGTNNWGIVTAPDGGVMGIYSKSDLKPLKTGNFGFANRWLGEKSTYTDWKFIYVPANFLAVPVY